MLVCGVDEAGRGPMFGPLVVAGVAIDSSRMNRLRRLRIRDSKKLSAKRRAELYPQIIKAADSYTISRISPSTIDKSVAVHGLNGLEAKFMGRIIERLGAQVAYVDACDTNAARFGAQVSGTCSARVRSHHKADERFVIVSAASVLAKVARDRAVARLGIMGSGYPSDPRTKRYLAAYVKKYRTVPKCARRNWKPVIRALKNHRATIIA